MKKEHQTISFQFFTNRFSILMFFVSFFHVVCKIYNNNKLIRQTIYQRCEIQNYEKLVNLVPIDREKFQKYKKIANPGIKDMEEIQNYKKEFNLVFQN